MPLDDAPKNPVIQQAILKCVSVVGAHDKICCHISGGYDSDIMLDLLVRCGAKEKTTFVFNNTGLEYDATKNHIKYLRDKYDVDIVELRPKEAIPTCVKKYGVPFISKFISEKIYYLQMHDFSWEDGTFEELTKLYPRNISSLKWWCNYSEKKYSYYNINRTANLKEYMMQHNPPMRISAVCCEKAKKSPIS